MSFVKFVKSVSLLSAIFLTNSSQAIDHKVNLSNNTTLVTYQVSSTKQIQQDEIQASLRVEKSNLKSSDVQNEINIAIKTALDFSKKYPEVKTSTGRYIVYNEEQKNYWKGSQVILLDSFSQSQISQFVGQLQKNGFVTENYSYILSDLKRTSMDNEMRAELIQKASQIASTIISKSLNKKFLRFTQIDFTSQNYYPVAAFRSVSLSTGNANISNNNPTAQSGLSDVQMTASVSALFGE